MNRRDIYLKIEKLPSYSPVAPDDAEHDKYRTDCMLNEGHHGGHIPEAEVDRRRLEAVVYREYLDAGYTIPQTAPIVAADINEPRWDRRIPGCVLYAEPGERLFVHVRNEDDAPHSFHVHGLVYGIDSDGSWPFGVHTHTGLAGHDDRRSDAICPGQEWCYVFDVTDETIGAWPFHDHHMDIAAAVDHGLFGGIVVRDPEWESCDIEVPFFLHRLAASARAAAIFDSGTMNPGATFSHTFADEGTFNYVCTFHPMSAVVRVTAAGAPSAAVNILDTPTPRFDPADVTIRPGGTVTWTHAGGMPHTVSDLGGAGLDSFALNGRTFVGNTPTIVAKSGSRIRWYVFDLDLGERWHNFHPHGQRFRVGAENMDTRSIGPAESFVVETTVPPVVLSPGDAYDRPSRKRRKRYRLRGDFIVHCHVEMHMMQGMVATVRAIQEVALTDDEAHGYGFHLPIDDGSPCPHVEHMPCKTPGQGRWESLPDVPIFVVHAAMLRTGKVLLWSGTAEVGDPLESRCWDPVTGTLTTQTYGEDLFCSGHAFLADGRLCVAGGAPSGTMRSTHIFDPGPETWTKVANMNQARWYPTVLTLGDGRILAASGTGASDLETYNPATNTWTLVGGATRTFSELYPSLHLLPGGQVFSSRAGWAQANAAVPGTALLTFTGTNSAAWSALGQQQFFDRQEGMAVIQVDTTVSPPATRVVMVGGGVSGAPVARNPQSAETIDLTQMAPTPAWARMPDMSFARTNVTAVLLPDGTILAVGGQRAGKWNADPQPVLEAEIFDPKTNTWTVTAPMAHPRQYHSVAVLLPDGRVMTAGGVDPSPGAPNRDQRFMEVFLPAYLDQGPRPAITAAPTNVAYASVFDVDSPDAPAVDAVVLLRPASVTHHTDAGQRYIKIPIQGRTPTRLNILAPTDGNIAPPGHYLLFILNGDGVPSEGRFVRIQ